MMQTLSPGSEAKRPLSCEGAEWSPFRVPAAAAVLVLRAYRAHRALGEEIGYLKSFPGMCLLLIQSEPLELPLARIDATTDATVLT